MGMKVVQIVLSLIAYADAKAIATGSICTIFGTCAANRACCVAISETLGGGRASTTKGICVKDGTNVGANLAVTHETTTTIKEGWYDTKAFSLDPCVSGYITKTKSTEDNMGATTLMATTAAAATLAYTLY